jgi:hypothetical protein
MMDKVLKPRDSVCYAPLSEPFTFNKNMVMGSNVTRNQDCCAGKGQQQFTQPDLSAMRMQI